MTRIQLGFLIICSVATVILGHPAYIYVIHPNFKYGWTDGPNNGVPPYFQPNNPGGVDLNFRPRPVTGGGGGGRPFNNIQPSNPGGNTGPQLPQESNELPKDAWPDKTVIYEIDKSFSSKSVGVIKGAIAEIAGKTCVKFREKTPKDINYVYIVKGEKGSGCFSDLGFMGGKQTLNLQEDTCVGHGTVVHEMLHVMSFNHEHSREDRDGFLDVQWDNIKPDAYPNFNTYPEADREVKYDYGSVLHYKGYAFAIKKKKPTLIPNQPGVSIKSIGQRAGMSKLDTLKVNFKYQCAVLPPPEKAGPNKYGV